MIEKLHYTDRDSWFAIRNDLVYKQSRLGASQVATACGLSKYGSPLRLYYDMVGQTKPSKQSKRMLFGLRIEPEIRFQYQTYSTDEMEWIQNMEQGLVVNPIEEVNYILTNSEYSNFFASLDFIDAKNPDFKYPVDSKASQFVVFKNWGGEIPTDYKAQLEIQAMIYGSEYASLAVLVEESIHLMGYNVDLEFRAELLEKSTEFLDKVKAGKQAYALQLEPGNTQKDIDELQHIIDSLAPAIDGLDDTTRFFEEKYSNSNGLSLVGSDVAQEHRNYYMNAIQLENEAKKIKTQAKNHFLSELKEFEKLELADGYVTYKNKRLSVK